MSTQRFHLGDLDAPNPSRTDRAAEVRELSMFVARLARALGRNNPLSEADSKLIDAAVGYLNRGQLMQPLRDEQS